MNHSDSDSNEEKEFSDVLEDITEYEYDVI